MKQQFTMAETAEILGIKQGVLKIWRVRDICRYGGDGARMAYSWIEVVKMGAALSISGMGVDLKRAFKIVDHPHAHQLFAAIIVGEEWPDRGLFLTFDPESRGDIRQWMIARFDIPQSTGFNDPVDHVVQSEGFLRVNLSVIGRRRLADIEAFLAKQG